MKDVFIPTKNYQRTEELVNELLDTSANVDLAVVCGRAGRGKTTAAQRITTINPRAAYVRWKEWLSPAGLVREIAFAVAGARAFSSSACADIIQEELTRNPRMLLVDEVDRVSLRHLNALRDIHDDCRIPILFIGEEKLRRKLSEERRLQSRVRAEILFEPVDQGDVVIFYRKSLDAAISPDTAVRLVRRAQGDFRLVVRDALRAERYMHASGVGIEDALAEVMRDGELADQSKN